jgi:hypothetical protein
MAWTLFPDVDFKPQLRHRYQVALALLLSGKWFCDVCADPIK